MRTSATLTEAQQGHRLCTIGQQQHGNHSQSSNSNSKPARCTQKWLHQGRKHDNLSSNSSKERCSAQQNGWSKKESTAGGAATEWLQPSGRHSKSNNSKSKARHSAQLHQIIKRSKSAIKADRDWWQQEEQQQQMSSNTCRGRRATRSASVTFACKVFLCHYHGHLTCKVTLHQSLAPETSNQNTAVESSTSLEVVLVALCSVK